MQLSFEQITDGIYRLRVPFENIYTGVFAVVSDGTCCLIDSASSAEDVREYILPALNERGWEPDWLLISHLHGDHVGGLPALKEHFPKAGIGMFRPAFREEYPDWELTLLRDGQMIGGCLQILNLPGHTEEALGFLDRRSGTLLSCDCLQLRGITRFGTGLSDMEAYLQTLQRLETMEIENIVTAHEFVPFGSTAMGRERVAEYLKTCREVVLELRAFVAQHMELSGAELMRLYNEMYPQFPSAQDGSMQCIREYLLHQPQE